MLLFHTPDNIKGCKPETPVYNRVPAALCIPEGSCNHTLYTSKLAVKQIYTDEHQRHSVLSVCVGDLCIVRLHKIKNWQVELLKLLQYLTILFGRVIRL